MDRRHDRRPGVAWNWRQGTWPTNWSSSSSRNRPELVSRHLTAVERAQRQEFLARHPGFDEKSLPVVKSAPDAVDSWIAAGRPVP
jgi:hypothetical protein